MLFQHELKVTLRKEDHRYFDQYQDEYTSNGQFHKEFIPEFDPDGQILKAVARKKGVSEQEVQDQWDQIAKISNDRGALIHDNLDNFFRLGKAKDPEYNGLCTSIYNYLGPRHYRAFYPEQIVFFPKKKIAGTMDLGAHRQKLIKKRPVLDIFDYKTQKDGIENEGKYCNMYKAPLDHLMHSNYTEIALKMSTYALMAEYTWGYVIGQMGIIYIPPTDVMSWYIIPVPYMKKEIIALVNHYSHAANPV